MLKCIFVLFTGPEEVLKFQGNDTIVDHFKLVLRDGNSLLIGARYVKKILFLFSWVLLKASIQSLYICPSL